MANKFTDDDLRHLKELVEKGSFQSHWIWKLLPTLLVRLEAAEKVALTTLGRAEDDVCDFCISEETDDGKTIHAKDCEIMEEIRSWRKAAGKEI